MIRKPTKKLTTLFLYLVTASSFSFSHTDDAYHHDSGAVANNANWMSRVDGNKSISELSLPGTHDTMSVKGGDISQNQTMTLTEQLNSGIRVFDMRTRHIGDKFRMHHGITAQDTYFGEDVLKPIDAFLNANPTETLLFRLRSEHTPSDNTRSYTETLNSYLAQYGAKRWIPTDDNPTLDEVRGKFIILQEFSGSAEDGINYGLSYGNINKQDDYAMSTNWDLYDKWTAVKNHMIKAKNGNRNTLYMNYLSAANGSLPYFVSSGHSSNGTSAPRLATGLTTPGWNNSYPDFPRVSCAIGICTIAFEGVNVLTADYMANSGLSAGDMPGIMMADFPGKRLIDNIINLNELSDYSFNEFAWGTAVNENTNLCVGGCKVEGDSFVQSAPAIKGDLTVVSYNVLRASAERVQNQIQWLKDKFGPQGPDVILLSETVRGASCGVGRNTAREYAKAFDAYYVNANEDGINSGCQTGNAIVSRFPMGNVGMVRYAAQDDSSDPTDGRNFVFADIKVGSDLVHVYSTHTHHSFGAEGDSIRQKQHAEMTYHSESKPFTRILGGDLNAIGHVFADPLGLHDISLNPFFDGDFTDTHDSIETLSRISAEAGLIDDDWTLILDFIFVKEGTSRNAGLCTSDYCRDSSVMSDHAPVWTTIKFKASNLDHSDLRINQMRSGDRYDFKLNTTAAGENCRLEWDSGLSGGGERNAKFDCHSNGDLMMLVVTSDPWVDGNGYQATKGYIMTLDGSCGLEWDGSLSGGGERNAKFDCNGGKDEVYITSHADGLLSNMIISSVSASGYAKTFCGLQWNGGSTVYGERNAKFDCNPDWDAMSMVDLSKQP